MHTRFVALFLGDIPPGIGSLKAHPGVELYSVSGPDAEHQIDMALLSDLHRPINLAFVGGDDARRFAAGYGGEWIESSATTRVDLLRIWGRNRS